MANVSAQTNGAIVVLALVMLPACAAATQKTAPTPIAGVAQGIRFEGGDGSSCATRVVILGASGSRDGVAAEHAWLQARYPGYRLRRQALAECEGHATDRLTLTTADGKDVTVHFDISDFLGKEFGP